MHTITRDELKALSEAQSGWCVSLFMPTHRPAAERQQDLIQFKNLLRQAEARLVAQEMRVPDVQALLSPALQMAGDNLIWRQPSDGLAVFVSPGLFRYYQLPLAFERAVVVAQRFALKPLLPLLGGEERFYVLALSQNAVRLLKGTRHSVEVVALHGVPQSMAEALRFEEQLKQTQWHTVGSPGRGGPIPIFHGQGTGIDDTKDRLLRFFQQVDAGLQSALRDEQSPLILAAVDYLMPIYRQVNRYPHLMEAGISGNPEERSAEELRVAGWSLVQPHFEKAQQDAIGVYRRFADGALASHDLPAIIRAAHQGRVQLLLVAAGAQRWGTFDPEADRVALHAEPAAADEDLLDRAAVQTYLQGGDVYVLASDAMPGEMPVAAVFRYA